MTKPQEGFTLIELMIVVAIVAILASIAYPSYREQVIKGQRSEGRSALLQIAQAQERFYTVNGSYATAVGALSGLSDIKDISGSTDNSGTTDNGYYTLSTTGGTTFTTTATAQNNDTDCTSMTLTHLGVKGGAGADSSQCW